MKVIFDGRVLGHRVFSGVENYAANIYEALALKMMVSLVKPSSTNRYMQQLWEHTKLPFLVSESDLLFCPANIAPIWLPRKTKLVLTLHDVAFKTFGGSFSKIFSKYYSFVIPWNIRRANEIITVSEASRHEIIKFYPEAEKKISVISLGIGKKFRVLPGIRKKRQILCVGSINERKNIAGVIEAFERLPGGLGYTLVIVGNFFGNFSLSSRMQKVLDQAALNSSIVFKEKLDVDALVYEYNISSCLVFPSLYEGFGLPPLEAMACGTPVITSNLSSMPEVCGSAALYVNPYDVSDISEKIQLLFEDELLQKEMITKGLKHVGCFTWEKAAKKHIQVFEKVLGCSSGKKNE